MHPSITETVYAYKTTFKEGFSPVEIEIILLKFPGINKQKFWNALRGVTGVMIKNIRIVYNDDLVTALRCGVENRDINQQEFD